MDLRKHQEPEPVEGKEDLTTQVLDWARDRTEALEGNGALTQAKPSQEAKRSQESTTKVSPRVIVVVLHEGTGNCGEAHLFEDLEAAGRFVETLVEEGLDEHRLTVFNCTQVSVHLTYRPVVHLKASEAEEDPDVQTDP